MVIIPLYVICFVPHRASWAAVKPRLGSGLDPTAVKLLFHERLGRTPVEISFSLQQKRISSGTLVW